MTSLNRDTVLALTFEPREVRVSRGRLELFDQVIRMALGVVGGGERPGASERDAVVRLPPTFYFSLELETHGMAYLDRLGVPIGSILHGEQEFRYHAACAAGDVVTVTPQIVDYYEKREGRMGFVVKETRFSRQDTLLAEARSTVITIPGAEG